MCGSVTDPGAPRRGRATDRPARRSARLSGAAPLLALALLAVPWGCGGRDRANPFDPANPQTGGRPPVLRAYAGANQVRLEWDDPGVTDIVSIRIARRISGTEAILNEVPLPPSARQFLDGGARNDSSYAYRLLFEIEGEEQYAESNEEEATPGTRVPWVLSGLDGRIHRITPDGRRIAGSASEGGFFDFALDPRNGELVAVDLAGSRVVRFDRDGARLWESREFEEPSALALDPGDGSAWIASYASGRVARISAAGEIALPVSRVFETPYDLAFSPGPRVLWVAEAAGRLVRVKLGETAVATLGGFLAPFAVLADPGEESAHVTDRAAGSVFRVAPEGDLVENRLDGFSVPTELARDPLEPGTVWVADTGAGHLWRIPASALTRADLPPPIQGGLEAPLSFAIDPGSGEIWVGDVGSDRIVRLARDGTVVRSLGFGSPLRVEVWWR